MFHPVIFESPVLIACIFPFVVVTFFASCGRSNMLRDIEFQLSNIPLSKVDILGVPIARPNPFVRNLCSMVKK